ncbi:MAG TPA: hypothetical protein VE030_08660, partial [Burkholderiales bacterium]|nr:hypothetical protein [Burkholderiales bacterium]
EKQYEERRIVVKAGELFAHLRRQYLLRPIIDPSNVSVRAFSLPLSFLRVLRGSLLFSAY